MKYIEFIQNIMFAHSSIKVVFNGSENTTILYLFLGTTVWRPVQH